MRCREVRTLLPERRLGLLSGDLCAEVDAHAAACDACSRERSFERELALGLASLREAPPLPIDVAARVMSALSREPVPHGARTRRRLLVAAAFAAVPLILFVGLAFPQAPSLAELVILAKHAVVALGSGIARVFTLLAPLGKLLAVFARMVAGLGVVLQALAPAAQVATAICLASMTLVTVTVLGRDWMRPSLARKEIE